MNAHFYSLLLLLSLCFFACSSQDGSSQSSSSTNEVIEQPEAPYGGLDVQGHRGCRGLLPENTIPAFLKAIDLGVTTLELDVVIGGSEEVVVSHEPWLNHTICKSPDGYSVDKDNELSWNLFTMEYDEQIKKCDCGSLGNPRFPDQVKMVAYKPLLTDVIETVEAYTKEKGLPPVRYNIEIKSMPDGVDLFHPAPAPFCDLVIPILEAQGIMDRMNLQSFDVAVLQHLHQTRPDIKLAYLIGLKRTIEEDLEILGFDPDIYSSDHTFVTPELVVYCHEKGIQVIPWTINSEDDMRRFISLGVDGIITDYPDRLIALLK